MTNFRVEARLQKALNAVSASSDTPQKPDYVEKLEVLIGVKCRFDKTNHANMAWRGLLRAENQVDEMVAIGKLGAAFATLGWNKPVDTLFDFSVVADKKKGVCVGVKVSPKGVEFHFWQKL